MNWTFINILMLFGALQGLVLALILIFKKVSNKKARLYLTLILLGLSMNLLYYFFIVSGLTETMPFLKLIYLPWSMLAAISFYLYIVFIAPFQNKLTVMNKIGFLPFILFSIILIVVKWTNYFALSEDKFNLNFVNSLFIFEEYFGIFLSLLLGFLSYKKLNKIEAQVQQQFSNYNSKKLQFHRRLIIIVLTFCIIWVIAVTYTQLNNIQSTSIYFSIWLFIAFTIHWIAWTGFINDGALLPVFKNTSTLDNDFTIQDTTDNKNTLRFSKENDYYKPLIYLFEKEQVYLQPDLSLDILSNKLGISKSYLSALINQTTNKNFYHFVNTYRVEHLITLFKDQKNKEFTILSLAYDSGFNSKSTFQSFFKKIKGVTPTQFIKTLEPEEMVA